jgi:hypothetical protein
MHPVNPGAAVPIAWQQASRATQSEPVLAVEVALLEADVELLLLLEETMPSVLVLEPQPAARHATERRSRDDLVHMRAT